MCGWGGITLLPCLTLQNVKQTQKYVLCREYKIDVIKCFAKVSKKEEEDLKPTGKALQFDE